MARFGIFFYSLLDYLFKQITYVISTILTVLNFMIICMKNILLCAYEMFISLHHITGMDTFWQWLEVRKFGPPYYNTFIIWSFFYQIQMIICYIIRYFAQWRSHLFSKYKSRIILYIVQFGKCNQNLRK